MRKERGTQVGARRRTPALAARPCLSRLGLVFSLTRSGAAALGLAFGGASLTFLAMPDSKRWEGKHRISRSHPSRGWDRVHAYSSGFLSKKMSRQAFCIV